MKPSTSDDTLLCPSAPADWPQARVVGVIGGSAAQPRMRPLAKPLPLSAELLALAGPVAPTEVFRIAAPCAQHGCRHFGQGSCHLAGKVVDLLPAVVERLPFCTMRASCRWFRQEGRAACIRCPQVVTDNPNASLSMRTAADPQVPRAEEAAATASPEPS